MKKSILTTLLLQFFTSSAWGIGVLLGNLFDQTGNMFYCACLYWPCRRQRLYDPSRKSSAIWSHYHYRPCHGPLFLGN